MLWQVFHEWKNVLNPDSAHNVVHDKLTHSRFCCFTHIVGPLRRNWGQEFYRKQARGRCSSGGLRRLLTARDTTSSFIPMSDSTALTTATLLASTRVSRDKSDTMISMLDGLLLTRTNDESKYIRAAPSIQVLHRYPLISQLRMHTLD
jgi:hypothetical protein